MVYEGGKTHKERVERAIALFNQATENWVRHCKEPVYGPRWLLYVYKSLISLVDFLNTKVLNRVKLQRDLTLVYGKGDVRTKTVTIKPKFYLALDYGSVEEINVSMIAGSKPIVYVQ